MTNKRLAIINSYNCGSTGTIACNIGDFAKDDGYEVLKCFPKHTKNIIQKKEDQYLFGIPFLYRLNDYICRATGLYGFFQFYNTYCLIKKLKKFNPTIVHLHNLHSSYVNLKMLFKYLSKNNIKVIWTLHDCWSFTGHCAHFTIAKCDKWKTGCGKCKRHYIDYPKSLIDVSALQWKRKNKLFNSIPNLTLVTPSIWLNALVKESFFKNRNTVVIRNGIDTKVFKPTKSNFRQKYGISDNTFCILGVAFAWNETKGLDVFIDLANKLDKTYKIVLVGTDDLIDKRLPDNIISIHRTMNQFELAEIYSAADLFVNPTRQEMLGMVNIEANACGTPVITFNTGGSPECIDETSGIVCEKNTTECLMDNIKKVKENYTFTSSECIKHSSKFNQSNKYGEYLFCFSKILNEE